MIGTRGVLRHLGITSDRRSMPHWGLYVTIAACEVVVLGAGAATGAPAWVLVVLGLLAVLMLALAVLSLRQRRRARDTHSRLGEVA